MKSVFFLGVATLAMIGYLLFRGDVPTQQAAAQSISPAELAESASRTFGGVPTSVDSRLLAAPVATAPPAIEVKAEAGVEASSPLGTVSGKAADLGAAETAESLAGQAERLLGENRLSEAQQAAEKCLTLAGARLNMTCVKILFNARLQQQDYAKANEAIDMCLQHYPNETFCLSGRAKIEELQRAKAAVAAHESEDPAGAPQETN